MVAPAENKNILEGSDLAAILSQRSGLPVRNVRAVLKELGAAVGDALKQGQLVRVPGLGTFRVRINSQDLSNKSANVAKKIVLVAAKKLKSEAL